MGLFLQQNSTNYFKSVRRDILEIFLSSKICIFDSNNGYTWFSLNMSNAPSFHCMYSILTKLRNPDIN